jgi:hypothetical protein
MLEIALVVSTLLSVALLGVLTTILTPHLMTEVGLWGLAAGLLTGVPTGFWYHVVLYRLLAHRMTMPARWWLSPVTLHPHLTDREAARIRPWFLAGGLGFALSLAGGLAAMAGLLMMV